VSDEPALTRSDVFGDDELAHATCEWVARELATLGPVDERIARTQVTFRGRRRGCAYVWDPSRNMRVDFHVVLSIALDHALESPRFRQVYRASPRIWQHHLVVRSLDDLDDEVRGWLRDAWAAAS
jgi:hypothetical protein